MQRVLLGLLALLLSQLGCASVNPHSAVRLSQQAMVSTHKLSVVLAEARVGLHAYVDAQTLSRSLLQQAPLSNETLCQLQSVSNSLRLREALLRRLGHAYEHYVLLAQEGPERWSGEVFDNLLLDLDPAELAMEPPLHEGCPSEPLSLIPSSLAQPDPPAPLRLTGSSAQLLRASQRLRGLLGQVITILDHERPVFVSILRQQLRSRASLAKAMYLRYGMLAPAELLIPTLSGLGLSYSELELRRGTKDADQQVLRQAVVQLLSARVDRQVGLLTAQYDQQVAILRALGRQHERLEAGQPMDLRVLTQWLVPTPPAAVVPAGSLATPALLP